MLFNISKLLLIIISFFFSLKHFQHLSPLFIIPGATPFPTFLEAIVLKALFLLHFGKSLAGPQTAVSFSTVLLSSFSHTLHHTVMKDFRKSTYAKLLTVLSLQRFFSIYCLTKHALGIIALENDYLGIWWSNTTYC